ncbi:MAG: hypothetical protein ACTSP4_08375, partial [Candidatus Hodarchaeales archaeon]
MLFRGKCPKCGCGTIGGPFRIHGGDSSHVKIDLPGFSTATLDAFTCCDCGFTEFYADQGGIDNVRRSGRFLHIAELERKSESER